MNRTGLLIALAIAVVVGLVFGLYPELDLKIAAPWFDPARLGFWVRIDPLYLWIRLLGTYLVSAIAAIAVIAVIWKFIQPRRPMLIPGRAALFMIATLAIGPGLVTNVILKDNWSRPRPIDVTEFGGTSHFVPWWDPRGDCDTNCSFVAGEPSGAFWTIAPAALLPMPWRAIAYAAALGFGAVIGFGRAAAGGHFVSDVVFSGVFTFLVIWLVHGLLYRWRATRITNEAVEGFIQRLAMPGYTALERLVARLRGRAKPL